MGISIALRTAERTDDLKEPVVLLERDRPGAGSSGGSSAILRQFYGSRCTASMARDSLRYFSGFENRTGRSIGFLRTGVLTLAQSRKPEDIARLEELVNMQASIGIDISVVNAAEIRELVHGMEVDEGTFGAWECGAGCVDADRTVEALASIARNKGAVIRNGTTAEEILIEEGRVVGVRTDREVIECEQVVLAAGPWSPRILDRLGVPHELSVTRTEHLFVCSTDPRVAAEHEEALFGMHGPEDSGATTWFSRDGIQEALRQAEGEAQNGSPAQRVAHPVVIDPEVGFYTRCEPLHSRARVGRFSYEGNQPVADPDRFDPTPSPAFAEWAMDALARRLPGYQGVTVQGGEAAMYTMTSDAQAILGPLPGIEGLILATGFSGHGFKLAPAVGEGVAQMLVGEPVSAFEPEFFSAERFLEEGGRVPPRPFGI